MAVTDGHTASLLCSVRRTSLSLLIVSTSLHSPPLPRPLLGLSMIAPSGTDQTCKNDWRGTNVVLTPHQARSYQIGSRSFPSNVVIAFNNIRVNWMRQVGTSNQDRKRRPSLHMTCKGCNESNGERRARLRRSATGVKWCARMRTL